MKEKENKGKNTTLRDKISLIITQLKLLYIYIYYIKSIPLPGVMVTLPQVLWGQLKTNHLAVLDKFKQKKPGKSSS